MEKLFVLQKNHRNYDFVYELINAIDYNNWFYGEQKYQYKYVSKDNLSKYKNAVPVGDLGYVKAYLNSHGKKMRKPEFIPKELESEYFLRRDIEKYRNIREEELVKIIGDKEKPLFIKDISGYKKPNGIIYKKTSLGLLQIGFPTDILVSEYKDILLEQRGFVYDGELLDIRHYWGDFKVKPSYYFIESIVKKIKDRLNYSKAYTVDVGVTEDNGSMVVELHPFVSCGLYGFRDYKVLPEMFVEGFEYLNRINKWDKND